MARRPGLVDLGVQSLVFGVWGQNPALTDRGQEILVTFCDLDQETDGAIMIVVVGVSSAPCLLARCFHLFNRGQRTGSLAGLDFDNVCQKVAATC